MRPNLVLDVFLKTRIIVLKDTNGKEDKNMAANNVPPLPSPHGRGGKTGVFVGDAIVKIRAIPQNTSTPTNGSKAATLYSLASDSGLLRPRKIKPDKTSC